MKRFFCKDLKEHPTEIKTTKKKMIPLTDEENKLYLRINHISRSLLYMKKN